MSSLQNLKVNHNLFHYDIPLSGLLQDSAEHLEMHLDAIRQQGDNRRPTKTHPARQRRL
jgi:hypothetical protein